FPPRGGPAPGARSARVSSRAVPPQRGGMGDDGRVVPPGCPFLGPDSHERSSFQAVAACRLLADPAAPCEPATAVGPAARPFHTPAPSAPGVPPLFPGGLLHRQRPPLSGPALLRLVLDLGLGGVAADGLDHLLTVRLGRVAFAGDGHDLAVVLQPEA